MLGNTGRHQALVLGLNSDLEADEAIFLLSALIPNRKAHPVIWSWYAVRCKGSQITGVEPLENVLKQFELGNRIRPNTTKPVALTTLNPLRQTVVDAVTTQVLAEREAFEAEMQPRLKQQLDELQRLRGAQEQQLELALGHSKQDEKFKDGRRNLRMKHIDRVFTDYQHWIEDTMQTEPAPYVQIIAVLARAED